MQNLADIFMGTVQYNDGFMNIGMICDVMTNKTRDDEREGYAGLVRLSKVRGTSSSRYIRKMCSSWTQKPQDVTIEPFLVQKEWLDRGLVVPPRGSNVCEMHITLLPL